MPTNSDINEQAATEGALYSLHRELSRYLTSVLKGEAKPLSASLIQEARLFLGDNGVDLESKKRSQPFLPVALAVFDDDDDITPQGGTH